MTLKTFPDLDCFYFLVYTTLKSTVHTLWFVLTKAKALVIYVNNKILPLKNKTKARLYVFT